MMTMREELIEKVARALAEPYLGAVHHPAGVLAETWRGLIPAATAAVDATLAGLEARRDDIFHDLEKSGVSFATQERCFVAMLKPLKGE